MNETPVLSKEDASKIVARNPKSAAARSPLAMGRALVARDDVNGLVGDMEDHIILKGTEVVTTPKFDEVVDAQTGEVYRLPLHVARNKEWYFHRAGLNDTLPLINHNEYVRELVRGNPGRTAGELWTLAQDEGFGPCNPIQSYGSFTATLSQNHNLEMRDLDGNVIKGAGHRTTNNTYWPKGYKGP